MENLEPRLELNKPAKRYLVAIPVLSKTYGTGSSAELTMRNVSNTGALLKILRNSEPFHKGELLRLEVNLDDINKTKVLSAEVIWTAGFSIGVKFVKPHDVIPKLIDIVLPI